MKNPCVVPTLFLFLFCLCAGCGTDDPDPVPGSLEGSCQYSSSYACWKCGEVEYGKDYGVFCQAQNDCAAICGPPPDGWAFCDPYAGPGYSNTMCNEWPLPARGDLTACAEEMNPEIGKPVYSCPFCVEGSKNAVTAARDSTGVCYFFSDTCVPRTFQAATTEECLQ